MSKHRPEHTAPPDMFYNEEEAEKYTSNSRMIHIQSQMTERCLELLALQNQGSSTSTTASAASNSGETTPSSPQLLLDVGCGSGLSGSIVEEAGHYTVGVDISKHMLEVGRRSINGDLFVGDIGQGFGFRAGMFDGAISVSALQWLCYSDKKEHKAHKRLSDFFQALYRCLRRGARAALQFYPESPEQIELITTVALKSGFSGGLVVDYPNSTKAKKYFLCLSVGPTLAHNLPKGLDDSATQNTVSMEKRRQEKKKGHVQRKGVKTKDWVKMKKERQRRQGKEVRMDSKFTGRKRKDKF